MKLNFRALSLKGKARIIAGLRRSWLPGGTHREMQRRRGECSSAETERRRAAWDAKGKLVASGISIYRSTARTNQFDLFINGEKRFTGGAVALSRWIRDTLCLQTLPANT